jgi:hypothetical protein
VVGLIAYFAIGVIAAFVPPFFLGGFARFWPSDPLLIAFGLGFLFIMLPILVYYSAGGRGDAFADEVLGRMP